MNQAKPTATDIERAIRNIPDFPKPGIQFKDITPLLADARLFAGSIDLLTANYKPGMVDAIVGIDARGFIFAAAAALSRTGLTNKVTISNTAPIPSPSMLTRSSRAAASC